MTCASMPQLRRRCVALNPFMWPVTSSRKRGSVENVATRTRDRAFTDTTMTTGRDTDAVSRKRGLQLEERALRQEHSSRRQAQSLAKRRAARARAPRKMSWARCRRRSRAQLASLDSLSRPPGNPPVALPVPSKAPPELRPSGPRPIPHDHLREKPQPTSVQRCYLDQITHDRHKARHRGTV